MNPHGAAHEHHQAAPTSLRWAVITVSDTRTTHDDESGALLVDGLTRAGHRVLEQLVIPDDRDEIRGTLAMFARDPEIDAVITNGGTGISPRDVSIEAAAGLIGKTLPGFGELFRTLSFETIGSAALASRAHAGTMPAPDAAKLLFQLPGSPDACTLALHELIIPEAGHLFAQANRGLDLHERLARRKHESPEPESEAGDDAVADEDDRRAHADDAVADAQDRQERTGDDPPRAPGDQDGR